ncbi:C-C motif chemokine 3-like [Elgaria multicarinata webbii]|uniref:C-C motif chemokine 3-like n=1 Tax=Elgaria multicarinata webbii TaxID=159646 RepID=UPI002FCCE6F8
MASLKPALLLALLLAISYQHVAAMCLSCPKECCFAVRRGLPILRKNMASYYKITSDCYLNAVVLVMKSGRRICVDPTTPWVKRAIADLPEKK